jgi:diguanylate cyclase (GGDEF)-like protein
VITAVAALLGPGQHTLNYQFATIVLVGNALFGLGVPLLYVDNRNLRKRVTTDQLTGALTRSFFIESARREIERARRFDEPISLLVFDLDFFKSLNDKHGHAFGDLVLTAVGKRCLNELRASDFLGRLGGEEFAVVLPKTDFEAAVDTAERLLTAVRSEPVASRRLSCIVTASFGVTSVDPKAETYIMAFERADEAMYMAKEAGRNRIHSAPIPSISEKSDEPQSSQA